MWKLETNLRAVPGTYGSSWYFCGILTAPFLSFTFACVLRSAFSASPFLSRRSASANHSPLSSLPRNEQDAHRVDNSKSIWSHKAINVGESGLECSVCCAVRQWGMTRIQTNKHCLYARVVEKHAESQTALAVMSVLRPDSWTCGSHFPKTRVKQATTITHKTEQRTNNTIVSRAS